MMRKIQVTVALFDEEPDDRGYTRESNRTQVFQASTVYSTSGCQYINNLVDLVLTQGAKVRLDHAVEGATE